MAQLKTKILTTKNTQSPTLCGSLSSKKITSSIGDKGTIAIRDHSKLSNLEYLNSGHIGFAGILLGTTAEWNAQIEYRPPEGMLVVYTDYQSYLDDEGQRIYVPGFKIGDGNAYLIDKPFVGEADSKLLEKHLMDNGVHIQPGEREFWNNKLNYEEPEDDL